MSICLSDAPNSRKQPDCCHHGGQATHTRWETSRLLQFLHFLEI